MSETTPAIEAIELHRLEVPLVRPFETSFGREIAREVLLVHVRTGAGEGWGECVAGRDPFYSGEYVDGAASVIERYLAPALLSAAPLAATATTTAADASGERPIDAPGSRGASVPLAASVAPTLAFVAGHRMAKGALEAAVLDAELRAQGRSMGEAFGAVREWVDCGVSVGIAPTIEELLDEVAGYVEEGYRRIKLKIKPGWDLVPVAAVRELLGADGRSRSTPTPPTRRPTSRCSQASTPSGSSSSSSPSPRRTSPRTCDSPRRARRRCASTSRSSTS
jgi:O-succinylbenzoate synthase